jgi:hypothetical protein
VIVKDRKALSVATPAPHAKGDMFELCVVQSVNEAGHILVETQGGAVLCCLWLSSNPSIELTAGLKVLVAAAGAEHVVVGVVGPYSAPVPQKRLTLEATEVLTLKCGEVSIDLRAADGKMMLRGEDVLLRAKGTQRIKAGSVSIN